MSEFLEVMEQVGYGVLFLLGVFLIVCFLGAFDD